jgi:hypothetical protein
MKATYFRNSTLLACSISAVLLASPASARDDQGGNDHSFKFFVINAPSSKSQGPDSILTFDSRGRRVAVFFGAENNRDGLRDIACNPKRPRNIVVSRSSFPSGAAGFLIFNASGRIVHTIPSGTPGTGVASAFDHAGNFYTVRHVPAAANQEPSATIFKNEVLLADLPPTGIGQLGVDSRGNLYLPDPSLSSRVFRIDAAGKVTIFADTTKGLSSPYGLAIDREDNVFVANNPGGRPAFILKFDPAGTVTPFATEISVQPIIRSMTFDPNGQLYAALDDANTILKFDKAGQPTVFASASSGLNSPGSIAGGNCPVGREEED